MPPIGSCRELNDPSRSRTPSWPPAAPIHSRPRRSACIDEQVLAEVLGDVVQRQQAAVAPPVQAEVEVAQPDVARRGGDGEDARQVRVLRQPERHEAAVGVGRDAALGGHPQLAVDALVQRQDHRAGQPVGARERPASPSREKRVRPDAVPSHSVPSGIASSTRTTPRSRRGVTRWGESRCRPPGVPSQRLPSRSSSSACTASLARPSRIVAMSVVCAAVAGSVRTRHSPCPCVATHIVSRRSCSSCTPQPACRVLRGAGRSPARWRKPSWKSLVHIVPARSRLKLK